MFEVIADGKILHVPGAKLKSWIDRQRRDLRGPQGLLFKQRPVIAD